MERGHPCPHFLVRTGNVVTGYERSELFLHTRIIINYKRNPVTTVPGSDLIPIEHPFAIKYPYSYQHKRGEYMERKTADEYPQELLDLFHEYQHGDMNRRSFLNHAARFAVGGLTVAAIFESLRPNYAWAQTVPQDDKDLKIGYETVDSPAGNGSIKGYLARPAKGKKFPAVLVIHENRGLNPYIEDVARRLAKAGYMAFAPDGLTSVGGYPGNDEKGAAAFRQVDGKKMTEDFVAAAKWLKARADSKGKLGAVGFCFGGGMVNQLAVRLGSDLNAGVAFYGRQAGADDVPKIRASTRASPPMKRLLRPTRKSTSSLCMTASSTGFTTTPPRATMPKPPNWPGSAHSISLKRISSEPGSGAAYRVYFRYLINSTGRVKQSWLER
jgi:carboxymethylenebutenolidase